MLTFIITAGGIGKRMGGSIPKQFLLLNDKPILMHTIERIHAFDSSAELIVTLPGDYLKDWDELCQKYTFQIPHQIVPGGEERFCYRRPAGLQRPEHGTDRQLCYPTQHRVDGSAT